MKHTLSFLISIVMLCLLSMCSISCNNNGTANKTASTDTTAKPKWVDPQKGKFWGKVNYVQIPLTAIENHILGPVKSVRYRDYKISEKDGSRVLNDSGYNVYDKFGHLVDQNEYNADGKPRWKCIYNYDDKNKATTWDLKISYYGDYTSKVTFKYDEKGNKIEENDVCSNDTFSSRIVYKYDDKGNETEEARFDAHDKPGWVTDYKYDNRGFQVEMTMKMGDGKTMRKATQEYDNNGDKISGIDYRSDTIIAGKWQATIDNKGRTIERADFDKTGALRSTTKMKYDDWDNLIEDLTYKPDGSMDTTAWNSYTEFEYDSKGNAIKETSYKIKAGKKTPTDFREAEYTYY